MPDCFNIELALNTEYISVSLKLFNRIREEGVALELRLRYWHIVWSQSKNGITFLFGPLGFHLWNRQYRSRNEQAAS